MNFQISVLCPTILLILVGHSSCDHGDSYGVLRPKPSLFRETLTLDGMWNFRLAPATSPNLCFEQEWHLQELSLVRELKFNCDEMQRMHEMK